VQEDEQGVPGGASTRRADVAHAVNHPTRRAILRALIEADQAMTLVELDDRVPTGGLGNLRYHVHILRREECVAEAGQVVLANGCLPTFAATVDRNQFVIGALDATRLEDELH
jgi:Helix-turn-helix domain